jgi:hypothetical protein
VETEDTDQTDRFSGFSVHRADFGARTGPVNLPASLVVCVRNEQNRSKDIAHVFSNTTGVN